MRQPSHQDSVLAKIRAENPELEEHNEGGIEKCFENIRKQNSEIEINDLMAKFKDEKWLWQAILFVIQERIAFYKLHKKQSNLKSMLKKCCSDRLQETKEEIDQKIKKHLENVELTVSEMGFMLVDIVLLIPHF